MIRHLGYALVCAITLSAATNAADPAADEELVLALSKMDAAGVSAALAQGANPNYLDPEINSVPLLIALAGKEPAIAMLLLEKGADAKVELVMNEMRVPALILAVKCGDPALVAKLIERGADPAATDSYGNTALTQAAYEGRAEIIKVLLANGVSPDQLDGQHRSALLWAIKTTNISLVKLLLAHGASPNLAGEGGLTPLMAAKSRNNQEIIATLHKAGAK